MAAVNTDKFKKLSRRWVGQIGSGGVADAAVTTVPLASATNLPTDTAVVAVIDRVDANGTTTATLEETVIGVVSGSNLTSCTRGVEGTNQAHSAGAVVEVLVTAKGWNDMVDGFLVGHTQLGVHSSNSDTQTLTNKRISPRITTITTSATPTPAGDTSDIFTVTALGEAAEFAAPTGTPVNGQKLIIRILDNNTGRALTWNSIYKVIGTTLPTTTVANKYTYVGCIYSTADSKWHVVAVLNEA